MSTTFTDKVALVTGAGAGMGLATARAFAAEGAAVVPADTDETTVRQAADDLIAEGHRALPVVCDVAVEAQVADLVQQTVAAFGRLDFAYNNAGVQTPNMETADADEFDRVQAINLRGVWNCMKYELQQMRTQSSGAIVNCASIGALIGIAGLGAYHASKHGVLGLTKSAALEYAARGIRINAVCPGIIATPMVERMTTTDAEAMDALLAQQPIARLGRPEEIAEAVLWLASDKATFVIGHALAVDGGYTIQ